MSPIRADLVRYLQYVHNTGGNCTIAIFDDDWEPIGPMLRAELMPKYVTEFLGKVVLTPAGLNELENARAMKGKA